MPSLTFELPHWIYWSGLVLLPLLAMVMVSRTRRHSPRRVSLAVGYLLWLCAGFVGMHRFYVRSWLGVVYIPLFIGILLGNVQHFEARTALSGARDELARIEFDVERFGEAAAEGAEGAAARLAQARQDLAAVEQQVAAARADYRQWDTITGLLGLVIAILLVIDAFLLPWYIRRQAALEPGHIPPPDQTVTKAEAEAEGADRGTAGDVHTRVTDWIDALSGWTGEFVAYWSVIAMFVYYFEVVSRYVFNSPTNWAHESMFLMFGMQYVISGAYALREGSHVRVDVLYQYLPRRGQIWTDIVTSVFFFIFTLTLLVTGWIYASDAIAMREVSFTEWAIQYWPVKASMVVGAALITLQGVSKLIKDFVMLSRLES